jgi:hypothetical protein
VCGHSVNAARLIRSNLPVFLIRPRAAPTCNLIGRMFADPLSEVGLRLHHTALQRARGLKQHVILLAGGGICQGAGQQDEIDQVHGESREQISNLPLLSSVANQGSPPFGGMQPVAQKVGQATRPRFVRIATDVYAAGCDHLAVRDVARHKVDVEYQIGDLLHPTRH